MTKPRMPRVAWRDATREFQFLHFTGPIRASRGLFLRASLTSGTHTRTATCSHLTLNLQHPSAPGSMQPRAERGAATRPHHNHTDTSAAAVTVYFIRHGTSEWNLLKKWQGETDTLLAPQGEAQARAEGELLRAAGVRRQRGSRVPPAPVARGLAAGASGAEIAMPADSESTGPRDSDSLGIPEPARSRKVSSSLWWPKPSTLERARETKRLIDRRVGALARMYTKTWHVARHKTSLLGAGT